MQAMKCDTDHAKAMQLSSAAFLAALKRAKSGPLIGGGDLRWSGTANDSTWMSAKPQDSRYVSPPARDRAAALARVESGDIVDRDPCFKCGTRGDVGCNCGAGQ